LWPDGVRHLSLGLAVAGLIAVCATTAAYLLEPLIASALRALATRPSQEVTGEVAAIGAAVLAVALVFTQAHRLAPENPAALVPLGPIRLDRTFWVLALVLIGGDFLLFRAIDAFLPSFPQWGSVPNGPAALLLFLFTTIVVFPVAEEIFFRGLLHTVFARTLGTAAAIVIPTLIFAAVHYEPTMMYALAILPGSFVLAVARHLTGGVTTPILLHMLANAAADAQLLMQVTGLVRG
jgi:membrane protease YdiL (CAAX protease family)